MTAPVTYSTGFDGIATFSRSIVTHTRVSSKDSFNTLHESSLRKFKPKTIERIIQYSQSFWNSQPTTTTTSTYAKIRNGNYE